MSKFVKDILTNELKDCYAGVEGGCVVELAGLDVHSTEAIRRKLMTKDARMRIVKNSLARRAFTGTGLAPLGAELVGPCALVTSPTTSSVEIAKTLVELAREFTKLKLKQALPDGDTSVVTVEELSKMRSKGELLGEVLMLVTSPGRKLAGCLAGPQSRIVGCIKAMADKEEEAAPAEAAA
jgi:large subunit ribosomal protein L10